MDSNFNLKYKDIKTLSSDDLKAQVASLRVSLEDLKLSSGQENKDNSRAKKIRRSIARLLTALNTEASVS